MVGTELTARHDSRGACAEDHCRGHTIMARCPTSVYDRHTRGRAQSPLPGCHEKTPVS